MRTPVRHIGRIADVHGAAARRGEAGFRAACRVPPNDSAHSLAG